MSTTSVHGGRKEESRAIWLIFVTTATTSDGVLFSSQCPFLHKERKLLAYFGQFCLFFVANIHTFWCTFTGLNDAVVPQN